MRALKYSKQMIDDISQLVYLHLCSHGYGDGTGSGFSVVRRYVTDAGALLPRLQRASRLHDPAACAGPRGCRLLRPAGRADRGAGRGSEVRSDLDGNQIMAVLDIPAGPQVGEAAHYLLSCG